MGTKHAEAYSSLTSCL